MNLKILTLSALLAFSFNSALALENHPSNNEEAIENILKDNQKVKSSITLPKGYKIKKLFKEAYLYGSFTDEVLIILHSPTTNEKTNNDYTIDDYIKLESSNSTCSAPINTKQGKQSIEELIKDCEYTSEYNDFETDILKKKTDLDVIEDGYFNEEELSHFG